MKPRTANWDSNYAKTVLLARFARCDSSTSNPDLLVRRFAPHCAGRDPRERSEWGYGRRTTEGSAPAGI